MRLRLKSSFRDGFDLFDPVSGKEVKPKSRKSERIREAQVKKEMERLRDEIDRSKITIGNLFRKVERLDSQKQELKNQVSLLSSSDDKYVKMKACIAEERQKAKIAMKCQRDAEQKAQAARREFKKKLREIQSKSTGDNGLEKELTNARQQLNEMKKKHESEIIKLRGELKKAAVKAAAISESKSSEKSKELTNVHEKLENERKRLLEAQRNVEKFKKACSAQAATVVELRQEITRAREEQGAYHETLKREHKKELSEMSQKMKRELTNARQQLKEMKKKHESEIIKLRGELKKAAVKAAAISESKSSEKSKELTNVHEKLENERKRLLEAQRNVEKFKKACSAQAATVVELRQEITRAREEQGAYHETLKREHKKELSEMSQKMKSEMDSMFEVKIRASMEKVKELEDVLEAHKEDASERENELRESLNKLQRERDHALSRVKELEVSVEESANSSGNIESELAQKKKDLLSLRSKLNESQSQVQQLERKFKEASRSIGEIEMQSSAKEESMQEQLSELKENSEKKIVELKNEITAIQAKLHASTSNGTEETLKRELEDARAEISSVKEEKQQLVTKIDKLRTIGIKWKMKFDALAQKSDK